jgi:peptidoglycan/LPS O-acetylase OafA/YrhL
MEGFWLRFHLYPEVDAHGVRQFTLTSVTISWGAAYLLFFLLYALRHLNLPSFLQWLGKISYSFYLLADIVLSILPRHGSPWLWIAECLIAITALSALTYRWIERPAMLLGSPPVRRRPVAA